VDKIKAYKLARPDGFDFFTGKTINYGTNIGGIVKPPKPDAKLGICSNGVIHASVKPNDCFVGAKIPCRAFLVEGQPVCGGKTKYGFIELSILEEIIDLDTLFGWRYSEVINPLNPLLIGKNKVTKSDVKLLKQWDSVRDSVWDSIWDSIRDSVRDSIRDSIGDSIGDSIRDSVRNSIWDSVRNSIGDSVGDSIWDSIGDSIWAYTGSLFPNITTWKYAPPDAKGYPYQSAVDLWKRGFVASYDGKLWRLHSGKDAKIVWEGVVNK